ncbi:hypothetical protein [Thioalkalivibrio sulfidiphilus]|uniref:TonB-dependent receptor n=1 Tax=Thioalkalivibrio sulfidiphilus (strain HL-EbGR7) TaxID=396588 RepID=B8GU03_THISH|nr:hypothetical protein [Thioalkalivibrio sulfidiphilus]ACL71286.1 TonB-dependent receptor [Thioalkalivibrio sulfidiphilus HL-EbGr7]
MGIDRAYLMWGLAYAVAGMCLGIFMAASQDHGQHVTHAHVLLVGFVLSLAYGIIHKLWLPGVSIKLARLQFLLHQVGAITMVVGLFLLYGRFVSLERLDPVLAMASIAVLGGALLMGFMVLKSRPTVA